MDLTKKWVIGWDTLCDGWDCFRECNQETGELLDEPIFFDSEEEAQKEIDDDPKFYDDCFIERADRFLHGRKTIFTVGGVHIQGKKIDKHGRIR